ncbi:MAG: hypothetical protein CMP91_11650 [Gammaproteobacteria bacterium]|nr:hypothetical protein [Gammaproteobacteria bacterium]MAY02237.1 hypothetical protein [Gammaproteobacteria bacterium]|tara:strand:- start:929 stop:1348 length:420 start_codon:yes stop_codon:yes gene_type:complete
MNQQAIFQPFMAMMLLTLVVWVYMYSKRIPFIRNSDLTPDQLTAFEFTRLSPPAVANPSDNFKNLFELPVVFYALCLYLYVTAQVDQAVLIGAWIFVGFRVLHSLVHCTVNIVMLRFVLYCLSSLVLWLMLLREVLRLF